ncbi:hypothetical protein HYALB_00009683 [Hymenoscyphus albidus]|uniref:DNase1 protein n=1 Tax=Hymenoscyphus albidus TaxID=595503 RepID=A0A9N9PQ94_9HELO|nr:hypothetical protein HYALB_00009683 [Hymenoscyphus albidus]
MQYLNIIAAMATIASIASANSIIFVSRYTTDRTVCWYSAPGSAIIPQIAVPRKGTVYVPIPEGWEGAWQTSKSATDCGPVDIRGEVKFNGFEDKSWYDVSAIDNLTNNEGVYWLYPQSGNGVHSGCEKFPCDTSYNRPDDKQTQVTDEKDLICEIGG